jgi:translocation protein SEC63
MLVQGAPSRNEPLLQLPNIDHDILKHIRIKKRAVRNIPDLIGLPENERRQLLRSLSDEEYEETMKVAKRHPRLEVLRVILKVIGDEVCTPGSIITFLLRLRLTKCGESTSDLPPAPAPGSAEEVDALLSADYDKVKERQRPDPAHAPYFPMVGDICCLRTYFDKLTHGYATE